MLLTQIPDFIENVLQYILYIWEAAEMGGHEDNEDILASPFAANELHVKHKWVELRAIQ